MIVTFCGHSQVADAKSVRAWLYKTIEDLIGKGADTFYLGGYGDFDSLCASVVRELKRTYPHIKSILVLPYPDKYFDTSGYDETLYPPLESTTAVRSILKNEVYVGDVIFRKTPSRNVITGEIDEDWKPKYVRDHHVGIVNRETWDNVQARRDASRRGGKRT